MSKMFDTFRAHPWHGLTAGKDAPNTVDAYIEITPFDAVKYEIDKKSGYLRVDRPQGSSALPPTLYGFIPQTYCDKRVAKFTEEADQGDKDPLDICVFSQQNINRAEVIVPARVVGGIQLLDGGEADDKIVALLASDPVFEYAKNLSQLPEAVVNRLIHYFATYKQSTTGEENPIKILGTYGADRAKEIVTASLQDYKEEFEI